MDKTIMKNLIFFFLVVFVVASCSDEGSAPEPLEPLSKEDSIKITLLKPSPTKEPYILLEDAGIEAELIAQGLDTDNQINGRISVEDADNIELFSRPFNMSFYVDQSEYLRLMLNRYYEVMPILEKEYKEKNGSELTVNSLDDVNKFKNLRFLFIGFPTEIIDSLNLSSNSQLEAFETWDTQIKVIDFSNCKQIKRIDFGFYMHPIKIIRLNNIHISQCLNLEYLRYTGDPRLLNISQNTKLKHLEIIRRGNLSNLEIEKLDLCNHSYLESLQERTGFYKNIYLAKNVYALYEKSKQQNIPNGFPQLGYGGEVHACK
jgi:hypothetical protein